MLRYAAFSHSHALRAIIKRGQKGDEKQLLGFLNSVLGRPGKERIESLEIMENTLFRKEYAKGKSCFLDLLAVLRDGTRVNIEVQLSNQYNMDRRTLYYWSRVYSESLNKGEDYRELPNVITVNILGFNFPRGGGIHTCFHLREDSDPSLILFSTLEIHCINMVQWGKLEGKDIHNDPLHRWLVLLDENSPAEQIEEVARMDGSIMAAKERLDFISQDEETYQLYWMRRKAQLDENGIRRYAHDEGRKEGIEQGREEGIQQGIQEGIQQGGKQTVVGIARKMKARNRPLSEIVEDTGLSLEAVKEL